MPQLRFRVTADKMPLPDTKRQLPKFRVWEESCRPGLGEQGELGPPGKRVTGNFTNISLSRFRTVNTWDSCDGSEKAPPHFF